MAARKKTQQRKPNERIRSKSRTARPDFIEDSELSSAQVRELEKRIEDLEDRTRYLLASTLGPSFVLYYNVSEDSYSWNEPAHATLFKRRNAAEAIQHLLGDRDGIYQCSVDKKGHLLKKSLLKMGDGSGKPSKKKRGAKSQVRHGRA